MSRITLSLLVLFLGVAYAATTLPSTDGADVVPNEFIVVFKTGVDAQLRASRVTGALSKMADGESRILRVWNFEGFSAYHALLLPGSPQELLTEEAADADTVVIEPNRRVRAIAESCGVQTNAEWNLERVNIQGDIKSRDFSGRFVQPEGQVVNAYIVDTGVYTAHEEFTGRIEWGANFADSVNDDCNGHGTHVAGTVGGTLYGICKNVHLIAVKVLDCDGSGTNAGVIDGVNYVVTEHKKRGKPSTANMSLGGGKSTALNKAVASAVKAGVSFVVAAGNENTDACTKSPASEASAITVGATTLTNIDSAQADARAYFSNYGSCVDIFAPGQSIKSAWIGSKSAVNTISGTSMASPHVCGAAAVHLALNPSASPAEVKAALEEASSKDVIDLACSNTACKGTINTMLYSNCA